jgi:hypothetical protein
LENFNNCRNSGKFFLIFEWKEKRKTSFICVKILSTSSGCPLKNDQNLVYSYNLEPESQLSLSRSLQLLCPKKARRAHINVKSIFLIFLTALKLGMADLSISVRLSVSNIYRRAVVSVMKGCLRNIEVKTGGSHFPYGLCRSSNVFNKTLCFRDSTSPPSSEIQAYFFGPSALNLWARN